MAQVHRLKVTLRGVRPPVWRRIEVASDTSLARLHHVLQIAMGWTDSHLHRFDTRHGAYGPMDIDEPDWRDERRTTLAKVAPDAGTAISYEYDFGDGWVHDVAVEDVGDADPAIHYPRCLTGRRACPPEDVGGPWGYQEFLTAPGDDFDPEAFSADAGTDALRTALVVEPKQAISPPADRPQLELSTSRFAGQLTPFATWAADRGEDVDLAGLELALIIRADFGGMPDPRRWHRGDLEELLLELLPRKALSRDVPPDELLPTLDAFLRFLENLADFGVRRTWQCCDASSAT